MTLLDILNIPSAARERYSRIHMYSNSNHSVVAQAMLSRNCLGVWI